MRSLARWLREKWSAMVPGRVYILGTLGVPTTGWGVLTSALPASIQLSSRAPNFEDGWSCQWRLWTPEPGITLDHPDSTYTVLRVAAETPPGRYTLECAYTRTSDGAEFVSAPFLITVLDPTQYE